MQMRLAVLARIFDSLLQNILRFLDELTVQIDCVIRDAAIGVILTENEVRGLLVILFHLCAVRLALFGQLLCSCAIAAIVCLARL